MLCLFAFAAALPLLSTSLQWLCALAAVAALLRLGRADLRFFLMGLWRLRWLFFAVAVLYLWRGGGAPLFEALPGLTEGGVAEASRRLGTLVALLAAVVLLVRTTPAPWLAAGLIWCLRPLRWLGLNVDRFGLRVGLVFAAVDEARGEAGALRQRGEGLDTAAARLLLRAESGHFNASACNPVPGLPLPRSRDGLVLLLAVLLLVWMTAQP